jgi:methylmalonyl-CoA mutase C-terminal domain/subunit
MPSLESSVRRAARAPQEVGRTVKRYRILIGKPGLDGHNRGVHVLVRALRDAGFEVIYTGIRRTVEQIVAAAVQEDVDGVGVSSLSGAHMALFPELAEQLRAAGSPALLFCGGIIPDEDRTALLEAGFAEVFGPGTSTGAITTWLREQLDTRSAHDTSGQDAPAREEQTRG